MAALKTAEIFRESLPRAPLCTDDFVEGVRHRRRELAAARRYVQPNVPHLKHWLVFDLDYPGAAVAWADANLPPPSFVAMNPANGHAHVGYGLASPVNLKARIEPIKYAAAAEAGLREALRADPGYCGLICKNPLSDSWRVTWGPAELYTLDFLAEHVDLKAPQRREAAAGLGRNCDLFDGLRAWAYQAVRGYWRPGGYTAWLEACQARAERLNAFAEPLPHAEVRCTARSVARWVWQNMTPGGFRRVQSMRASRRGHKCRELGMALLADGWSAKAVQEASGVSRMTVWNWKKRLSEKAALCADNSLNPKGDALGCKFAISDKPYQGPAGVQGDESMPDTRAVFFKTGSD